MMEQVKSLKNGVGIQSLLDAAYRILGNPIVMFDTDYSLIAYTDIVTDDPIWNEIVSHGVFSEETQEFFNNEGFVEAVANMGRITFMTSDKLKYDRISGKVFNKNNYFVANLVMVGCNKPIESHDSKIFEAVCMLITREISKSDYYQTYEKIHQEAFIKYLVDGNFNDRDRYVGHVAIIYDKLKANLYLAVVDISKSDPDFIRLEYFRDLFMQIQPAYKYAIYSNYILIIISTDNRTFSVNKELNELNKIFEQNSMYAGISNKFENLYELHKHFKEAQKALRYVLEGKSSQRIFPHGIHSINKMEEMRALKNGLGVKYLLNAAFKILGNPVLLNDVELKLVAYTENAEVDDPIWKEYITYGTVSNKTIEFFQNEGFADALANTKSTTFFTCKKLKFDRIVGKIYNKDNVMVGCLNLIACNKPFEDDEITHFGVFCETLSKEVSGIDFYNIYGQEYSETLVSKLIDGNIDDDVLFSDAIENIYDNLKSNLYLAVVDISQCDPELIRLEYFRDLFKKVQTAYSYAIYSNYIIIIISTDNSSLDINKELNEISKLFEQNNISAGLSSCFGNVYEMQKHYAEAVKALNNGLKNKEQRGNQRIFPYNEACSKVITSKTL